MINKDIIDAFKIIAKDKDIERVGTRGGTPSVSDMGKPPKGQWDNLPEVFVSIDGDEYKIKDIHSLMTPLSKGGSSL